MLAGPSNCRQLSYDRGRSNQCRIKQKWLITINTRLILFTIKIWIVKSESRAGQYHEKSQIVRTWTIFNFHSQPELFGEVTEVVQYWAISGTNSVKNREFFATDHDKSAIKHKQDSTRPFKEERVVVLVAHSLGNRHLVRQLCVHVYLGSKQAWIL